MELARTNAGRSRNWLFTINRIEDNTVPQLRALGGRPGVKYMVWGSELAPTTGHAHLQGFIQFVNARKFTGVKKLFGFMSPRLDRGDGKSVEMMKYCKKDNCFEEIGTPPMTNEEAGATGARKREMNFKQAIKLAEQGKFDKLRKKWPGMFIRYYRTWLAIHKDSGVRPPDLDQVTGIWVYGPSGSGKSHYARERFPLYYDKACNKWFDNYQQEPAVLIDDFDKKHDVLAHHLKRWADRYSFSGEIKGGQINLRPEWIVVTSQYRISDIWSDTETVEALNRRFIKIKIHIDSQGNRVIQEQGF